MFMRRFAQKTGIGELMDDLGDAMQGRTSMKMLGGGNPAHIPEVNKIWRRRFQEIMDKEGELEQTLANYDTPQGKHSFLIALADFFNKTYGWNLSTKNIAITNGSQTAFFLLLNMFSGQTLSGKMQNVLLPLCPEYIGYADQTIEKKSLMTRPASIEHTRERFFKYHIDFDCLDIPDSVSALCVSRPTNPTGNVLTDEEIARLLSIAQERDIPLIIDNAYGAPFPNIIFKEIQPCWEKNIILTMSLSKLGLPSLRTGIVVGSEEVIQAVSSCNAVLSLSNGSLGQVIVQPLLESGEILDITRQIIQPFYREQSLHAQSVLINTFGNRFPYHMHESEGAMFLWVWFPGLPITSFELYQQLKDKGVLVVSGHYFFYGLQKSDAHSNECLRISFAQDKENFAEAMEIIAHHVENL